MYGILRELIGPKKGSYFMDETALIYLGRLVFIVEFIALACNGIVACFELTSTMPLFGSS